MEIIDMHKWSEFNYLIVLAVILLVTKFLGLVSKKVRMPQVVGALLAGVLLGPVVNGIMGVQAIDGFFSSAAASDKFFGLLSEIGVIVLMFSAGIETDVKEMKKCGKASFVIALIGVIVPLLMGGGAAWFFIEGEFSVKLLKSVFIGVVLTATSVSITVETLKELGKLNTRASNAILGAAIIDDILGIIALTVITSFADDSVSIGIVLIKIILFFIFAFASGFAAYSFFKWLNGRVKRDRRRHAVFAFAYCLGMAFCSEVFFGVADITGAYIAGLVLSTTRNKHYFEVRFNILSYLLLSPIFFAGIGLNIEVPSLSLSLILFAVLLTIMAVASKFFGCALGGKICGYDAKESFQIGAGMISRGEVALIVANKGAACGLMDKEYFGPLVIVVVITTIIAPVFLKILFEDKNKPKDKQKKPKKQLA